MARLLGLILTIGRFEGWVEFAHAAQRYLTPEERAAMAYGALISLDAPTVMAAAEAALQPQGEPLPPFLGSMTDARHWAARATCEERRAYALAAFEAMDTKSQNSFFRHIGEIEVAA